MKTSMMIAIDGLVAKNFPDEENTTFMTLMILFNTIYKQAITAMSNGRSRSDTIRTCGIVIPNHAFYQLNYTPITATTNFIQNRMYSHSLSPLIRWIHE